MLTDQRVKQFNKLIIRLARDDVSALDALYEGYGGLLNAMAKKYLSDKSLADDVLSEVYCKLVKGAKTFNPKKNGLNWAFKIVKNTCLDFNSRITKTATENLDEWFNLADALHTPENTIESIDLRAALRLLTEEENRLLYLKFWEGLTVREIAKQLHRPKSTIQYMIEQCLKKISDYMDMKQ